MTSHWPLRRWGMCTPRASLKSKTRIERQQVCICGDGKQVQIWKQTHRGSNQHSAWGYTAKHQVIPRTGRPRCIKSQLLPCQSLIIYTHNKKNPHKGIRPPKLFSVHLEADMLDCHFVVASVRDWKSSWSAIVYVFFPLDLRRRFKNKTEKIPCRLQSKSFKLQQPCPPLSYLPSWWAAKSLMWHPYKSTHLLPHSTITRNSYLPLFALSGESVLP